MSLVFSQVIAVSVFGKCIFKSIYLSECLRVNITIVYEHTVCATSAFSMCMLCVVFNIILF